MSLLTDLQPTERKTVMELLAEAEHDVSDWANYKGGKKRASANPKYCYDWAFVSPGKSVALSLWFEELEERGGTLVREIRLNHLTPAIAKPSQRSTWTRRGKAMFAAIRLAHEQDLPVRVIIGVGARSDFDAGVKSTIKLRLLDPVCWKVTSFNESEGAALLMRDSEAAIAADARLRFADQFDPAVVASEAPETREAVRFEYVRSRRVRDLALARSNGQCDACGSYGFLLPDGRTYLETHHIVSLGEGGADTLDNVVALCANDHRRAHYSCDKDDMRSQFQQRNRSRALSEAFAATAAKSAALREESI